MSRHRELIRAFLAMVGRDEHGDGDVTEHLLWYLCTLAAFEVCGPGSAGYAQQASALWMEVMAAYAEAGFPVEHISATGEPVYDREGLVSAAQRLERTADRRR